MNGKIAFVLFMCCLACAKCCDLSIEVNFSSRRIGKNLLDQTIYEVADGAGVVNCSTAIPLLPE